MKSLKSAPIVVLSALLAGSTALSSASFAACNSCQAAKAASSQTAAPRTVVRQSFFQNNRPQVSSTHQTIIPGNISSSDSHDLRKTASGPIFGDDDCSRNGGPIFGDDDCSRNGHPMFGPDGCDKGLSRCKVCKKKAKPAPIVAQERRSYIKNYKIIPETKSYERLHKCSDLAPFQLEWVDFRINDGHSESFSRKLGNYRFRLFGCRRFSKAAMLNEGRIIQKDMQFIDIFEDAVEDCYNIVKVPNDLCLRDQDYEAPEYILTAEITDYFMNVCDGYDWDNAEKADKRTGSAEMTVTWRLLDLTKTKVLWKGETTGYSDLEDGSYDGEIDLIEQAFADAALNLKGLPEFEDQLAIRVPPEVLEQQKTTLLAIEQASDPIKCRVAVPQATSCPIPEDFAVDVNTALQTGTTYYDPNTKLYYDPTTKTYYDEQGRVYGSGYQNSDQQTKTVYYDPNTKLYYDPSTNTYYDEKGQVYSSGYTTSYGPNGEVYLQPQQCPMSAEILDYEQTPETEIYEPIPLEQSGFGGVPYAENAGSICYSHNDAGLLDFNANTIESAGGFNAYPLSTAPGICESTLDYYLEPETENACENPLFGEEGQECDPSLVSFIQADQECQKHNLEELVTEPEPQVCLFANDDVEGAGGISKDSGYYMPDVEALTPSDNIKRPGDWQPYDKATESRTPDVQAEEDLPPCPSGTTEAQTETIELPDGTIITRPICKVVEDLLPPCPAGTTEAETETIELPDGTTTTRPICKVVEDLLPPCPAGTTEAETETIELPDGTTTTRPICKVVEEVLEESNYKTDANFCIENIAPYPDMRPENLYRVRASMMSVKNTKGAQSAGLLIAKDLLLTSADAIDNQDGTYEIETINGVKTTAKVVRINVKKNIALLQTKDAMYFRPLSLNLDLPKVGDKGYMSLGLLNNAEGENYLDDKGVIKGYRFSDQMGTEIITDTFVQNVSAGGALINEKGVVTGLASRNQKFDDRGDLFLPIQDAINSVGLKVCGQQETYVQAPLAVIKPVSTAIDSNKGSKEPEVMGSKKRK